jgi:hypothetical protein
MEKTGENIYISAEPEKENEEYTQRDILRDRRSSTAACPACWAIWTKELK